VAAEKMARAKREKESLGKLSNSDIQAIYEDMTALTTRERNAGVHKCR